MIVQRGEAEMNCLEYVRKNGITNCLLGDCMLSDNKFWYGLHYIKGIENDPKFLADFIMNCKANPYPSLFPDFVHPDGFIEHFRFSPSDTECHGSQYIAADNKTCNKMERALSDINHQKLQDFGAPALVGTFGRSSFPVPEGSYDCAFESFKRHWDKHIKSLEKYDGVKNTGVFLIECLEFGLSLHENVREGLRENVHTGDLIGTAEVHHCVRLSRCPEFLDYMYKDRDKIKYVIYVCPEAIEFFRVDELMYIKSLIRHSFSKSWCPGFEERVSLCITEKVQSKAYTNYLNDKGILPSGFQNDSGGSK